MIDAHFVALLKEEKYAQQLLHLTANESLMSQTARHFMGSPLNDLYYMGGGDEDGIVDFGPFTFRGSTPIQNLVSDAERALKTMLGATSVNLGCLSGVHAMMCVILSTTNPGDTIMSVDLQHGGHFATQGIIEQSGRKHISTVYDFESLSFDTEKLAKAYHDAQAKAFYIDASFYIKPHNLRDIRRALGDDAIIIYDASHTLGLIMGGKFQDPFNEGADVICANTHKTLPGPQKGLIAFKDEQLSESANAIINNGLYSSSHTSSMIALAITILEMEQYGKDYAKQIISNANALGRALEELGFEVRKDSEGRYTENHQVHLMTEHLGNYRELYKKLLGQGVSVNFDNTLGGKMYIRIGTQSITRKGMKQVEMLEIAEILSKIFTGDEARGQVTALLSRFPAVAYSFDEEMRSHVG